MIWIPLLQAYVTSGDFLLASPQAEALPSICHITDTIAPDALQVTWWWRRNELTSFASLEALPPLNVATHHNVQLCNIA
jgi:hypothetical protein